MAEGGRRPGLAAWIDANDVALAWSPQDILRGTVRLRDYYRIEDGEGRRYWIYRQGLVGDGRGGLPQWFLQGLCA